VNSDAAGESANPQFGIHTQYVKHLNFENMHMPDEFSSTRNKSKIDVKIDIEVEPLSEGSYEISLRIIANSRLDETLLFHFDLTYAAVFYISGIAKDSIQALLLIECPKAIFPFARRVIFETTRESGHAPLMLSPIDFFSHFLKRQKA